MGLFSFFRSDSAQLREKIIFTQKNRIGSLERDLKDSRERLEKKEEETSKIRDQYEKSKERLVDQIIELSDKFADINQKMLDIAHENARLKHMVQGKKKKK